MNDNVVNFNQHVEDTEKLIWMCDCGNSSFTICADGQVECAECDVPQTCTDHHQTVKRWTRKERITKDC